MTDRPPRRWWRPVAALAAAVTIVVLAVVAGPSDDRSPEDADPTPAPTAPNTAEPTPSPTAGTTASPTAAAGCSAADLPASPSPQPELPDEVAELRDRIARHAVACDLAGLAALAGEEFTYSFGGGEDPVAFWREREEDTSTDEPQPMEALRLLLDAPPGTETSGDGGAVYWTWPRLHVLDQDAPEDELDAAMEAVVATGLYTREHLESMYELVGGYTGYRVVIEVAEDSGEAGWTAFVAGD